MNSPNRKPVRSQSTISKLFERQKLRNQTGDAGQTLVQCPVCDLKVSHRKINYHLDNECKIETAEKSPYFRNEDLSSNLLPVKRKLSLSLGRKRIRTATEEVTKTDIVGNAAGPKDVIAHIALLTSPRNPAMEENAGLDVDNFDHGLPEQQVSADHMSSHTNKRLKLTRKASDFKNARSSTVSEVSTDISSPTASCSKSSLKLSISPLLESPEKDCETPNFDHGLPEQQVSADHMSSHTNKRLKLTRKASDFKNARSSTVPEVSTDIISPTASCSKSSRKPSISPLLESPEKDCETPNCFSDLRTPEKSENAGLAVYNFDHGLPEQKVSVHTETMSSHTNKRLKLTRKASDFKNARSSTVSKVSTNIISPTASCSKSSLKPSISPLFGSPEKDCQTSNYFSDLRTPEKSTVARTITNRSKAASPASKFSSSANSPFKSPLPHVSPSPRKLRFLEKIPSCFNELRLLFSPEKTNSNHEAIPKSCQLCPMQLSLRFPEEPVNDYFSSPIRKDIDSSQGSNSGTLFYYLSNFLDILREVLEMREDRALFSEEDLQIVKHFYLLPDKCQELFVRLFARKHHWFRKEKIKYPEIAHDLEPVLDELIDVDFLENGDNIKELKTILSLLPSASMKNLCKLLNLKVNTQKAEMMQEILKHCSKQNGMFRTFGSTSRLEDVAIKKAKTLLGQCYRLRDEPRRIFVRILMLYSLTDTVEDGMQEDSPAQLTTMLLINMGKFVFPPYKVLRSVQIFRSRDDFLMYEKAVLLEGQILNSMESKTFANALDLCNTALECYNDLITREDMISHDRSLPTFLRFFSSGQVFTRCINQRVEVLQKLHDYTSAVTQLNQLLEQDLYCQQYRGHWIERLALNLDQHLQQTHESLEVIEKALVDPRVANSHKLALYQRAERIAGAKKNQKTLKKDCLKCITKISVTKVKECHIEGKNIPNNVPGYKSVFLCDEVSSSGNGVDVVACSVEEFALSHYRNCNYPEGIHGEGSALVSLFGLLFWDIIYCPGVPDAFRSTHQFYPLDLNSREFYDNRKIAIDARIALLKNTSVEELNDRIRQCWRSHEGQTSLVNWDMYRSFEFVQSLVACIGSNCLANICERFAKNFRHFRSGVPDLTVWNTEAKQWMMIEVKGPGDRLSHKQLFWLDYLHGIGVTVEVCYVKAIGSKKLRKTSLHHDGACK